MTEARVARKTGWLVSWVAAIIAAAVALSSCAKPVGPAATAPATGAAPVVKMSIAYSEIVFSNLPLWVAKESGIFEKNSLDVDLQQISSSNAIAALLSGQVQAAHAGGSEALSANLSGADLEIVGVVGGVYPYYLMAQPSIKTIDDLRGKKIGVSQPGSSSDIATRTALKANGIDPDKDVTIVPVGSLANRTAALLSGAIDAGLDNPPGSIKQEAQGLHALIDLAAQKLPASNNTIVMQRSFVDGNKDAVQRYVDSIMQAMAKVRNDRAYAVQILKQYYQSDDDAAMNATYDFLLETMPDQPFPSTDQFKDVLDQLQAKGQPATEADVTKMITTSFVQNAVDRKVGANVS